jgi:hypothetical protein
VAAVLVGTSAGSAGAVTSSISGTVYPHSGSTGLAGAAVTAYAPQEPVPGHVVGWAPAATTRSAADGTYTLSGLTGDGYRVKVVPANLAADSYGYWASNDGITPWLTTAGAVAAGATGVDVHLTAPATISGTVTDTKSLRGIAGIQVRAMSAAVYDGEINEGPGGPSYGSDYLAATTDRRGRYVLTGLPSAAPTPEETVYGVTAVDPAGAHSCWYWWFSYVGAYNYTPEVVVDGTHLTATRSFQLQPSGVLKVHVTDTTGHAVAGLRVMPDTAFVYPYLLTDAKGNAYIGGMGIDRNPVTAYVSDQNGPADPTHAYRTVWFGQAMSYAYATKVTVTLGRTTTLNIRVARDAAAVTGTAQDAWENVYATDALPAPGNGDLQWKLSTGWLTSTGEDWFLATGLWPGVDLTAVFFPGSGSQVAVPLGSLAPNTLTDLGTITFP